MMTVDNVYLIILDRSFGIGAVRYVAANFMNKNIQLNYKVHSTKIATDL